MKQRDSNMELLRIVAMLLVMVVHASYRALPKPQMQDVIAYPSSTFLQLMTESFSIIAVDLFIMLSGWYGIKMRFSRLSELFFQVLFFGLVCAGISCWIEGGIPQDVIKHLLMLGENDYWFIKTYLALYLLSPVLNSFVETASRRQFSMVLLCFFIFQWIYGWVFEATSWLRAGYSLPSFMALYLLARYIKIHRPWFAQFRRFTDLFIYLYIGSCMTIVIFFLKRTWNIGGILLFYNSPIVILGSMYLLLFFSKLSFHNKIVNWVAISVLSIYLTHSNSYIGKYYDLFISQWHCNENVFTFIFYTISLVVVVFISSVFLDKVRIMIWRRIQAGLNKYLISRLPFHK